MLTKIKYFYIYIETGYFPIEKYFVALLIEFSKENHASQKSKINI